MITTEIVIVKKHDKNGKNNVIGISYSIINNRYGNSNSNSNNKDI